MPTLALLCVFATSVFSLAGCCCYDEGIDHALKRTEARLAYAEPCDCPVPAGVGADYERGWRAGYLDVSEGRSGTPPVVAPHRYRTYKYQTGSGRQAAAAWYQGFAAGAAAAKCQGLDQANRVFSVESPCMDCQGQCECASPGVLPTAEAMLRQQQYRNGGQIVIEHEVMPGEVINPQFAPTPVQPGVPMIMGPEAVETPEIVAPSPDASSALRPNATSEPTGPELSLTEVPSAPATVRSAQTDLHIAPEARTLVDRVVAPPSPVELPSNVERLQEAAEAPVAAPKAEKQLAMANPVAEESAAPTAPSPASIVATPSVEPALPKGIAPQEVPLAKKPVRVAVQPAPQLPVPAPAASTREPSLAAIVETVEPSAKQELEATDSATSPSLAQPKAITSLDSVAGTKSSKLAPAPLPKVTVKETPEITVRETVVKRKPSKLQPPKEFPLAELTAPSVSQPVEPEIAVPDEIGFPTKVIPSDKPVFSSREASVPKAWNVQQPRPFANVTPKPANVTPEHLKLPQSVLGTPTLEPTPKATKTPDTVRRRSSLLPKRLASVPRGLSLPESVAKSYQTGTADRTQPTPIEIQLELTQPESLLAGIHLQSANTLGYPHDISYSLNDHGLEEVASPMELKQPNRLEPAEALYEIKFPATVWPASYEIETPPAQ